MAGARCCPCLCFNLKFLYEDELVFVVYLLFFELYLFVTSVGLVFSQGVPHVADKKDLSAPLATEPQAPSVADSLCSSGRRSGSGRGPKNVTPLLKGYKRWLLREMVGQWPWTFGGFLWGVSVFLSRWLHPISSSTAASVCVLGLRVLCRL